MCAQLYFGAYHPAHGKELWVHDPSAGTTSMVIDLSPGSEGWQNLLLGSDRQYSETNYASEITMSSGWGSTGLFGTRMFASSDNKLYFWGKVGRAPH